MSGQDPKDDKDDKGDKQGDDTPIMAAGVQLMGSDGQIQAVFKRNGDGQKQQAQPAAAQPAASPAGAASPSHPGRSLGGGGASVNDDEMRQRRLAMLQSQQSVSTPSKQQTSASAATPSPSPVQMHHRAEPGSASKPATPQVTSPVTPSRTPAKLMQESLSKEPNCGYLVRYVLQIQKNDQDFDDQNIPSLLSAIFMGEQEGYDKVGDAALWERLDQAGLEQVDEGMMEAAIEAHRMRDDDEFIINSFGRIKRCLADMFVRQSFTPSCEAMKNALRIHYLSSFIPAVLDDGAEKSKTLRTLLYHVDTQAATELLEEIAIHLSDDIETGADIVQKIANSLLYENEQDVQAQGLPILTRFCGFLVRLSRSAAGAQVLREILSREASQAFNPSFGVQFAAQCWLRRFLMLPQAEEVKTLLKQVNNYPKTHPQETEPVLSRPREVVSGILKDLSNMMRDSLLKSGAAGRAVVLGWTRQLLRASHGRTETTKNNMQMSRSRSMPDLFALNLAWVSFTLSDPVCQKLGEKATLEYARSGAATAHFPSWGTAPKMDKEYSGEVPQGPAAGYNFATEILFASVQGMHTLVMPAVRVARWAHEAYMRSLSHAMQGGGQGGSDPRLIAMALEWDLLRLQLLSPSFVDMATSLAVTVCSVVERELAAHGSAEGLPVNVAAMPAFMLEDALDWAVFVCNYGPHLVKGTEGMPRLLQFAVTACTHPTLLRRHPLLESRVVCLIAAMQENQQGKRSSFGNDVWAASQWSTHRSETSLFNIVERSPVCGELPRVLFRVYSSSINEGFDIDKDDHLAHAHDLVLPLFVQLIVVAPFKQGLMRGLQSRGEGSAEGEDDFSQFVHKLVTEGTHCLDDSLNRLTEVNDIAQLMKDKVGWEGLPGMQRKTKEAHMEAQGRSARGFMASANKALQVVQMLLNPNRDDVPPPVPTALAAPPVLRSLSHLVRYFLVQLQGKRGDNLRSLPTPQKYDYDRLGIVQILCQVVSLLAGESEFVKVFALHDDYERWVVLATLEEVKRTQLGGLQLLNRLQGFADSLQALAPQSSAVPVSEMSEASWNPPTGKLASSDPEKFQEAFEDIHFESTDLGTDTGYRGFAFRDEVEKAGALGANARSLQTAFKREWKLFPDMPLYPQASIFMRCDETRMGVMRMLVTGPEESSYAFGMFVFDVFMPPSYPEAPPMVVLRTTGGGTVRFNPNLYENGKVCLSLLGTWYGDGAETKWQPKVSSLYQVGTSIQSMILVPDPYFNEPGNERERGTPEGDKWSGEYNEGLRLATLRYAILENIKSPPAGCEEIVAAYYKAMAPVVLSTAHRWAAESSVERRSKFLKVLEQLHEALGDGEGTNVCTWVTAGRAQLAGKKRELPGGTDVRRQAPGPSHAASSGQSHADSLGMALMAALQGSEGATDAELLEQEDIARALEASMADQ